MNPPLVVSVGELLWDILPGGERLGGAVANVAVMASRLGSHSVLLSRVGEDDLGARALHELGATPVDGSMIEQDDSRLPTGTVEVTLDARSEPNYQVTEPVAWDALDANMAWLKLSGEADAICFGTLAQRRAPSRQSIRQCVESTRDACLRVFDANLRTPFYSHEVLTWSLENASVLKVNSDELPLILSMLEIAVPASNVSSNALRLLEHFQHLRLVAVTMGAEGSYLVTRNLTDRNAGFPVDVVDPVGAGDAFSAAVIHFWLKGASLPAINQAGNLCGSYVASMRGAMPVLSDSIAQKLKDILAADKGAPASAVAPAL